MINILILLIGAMNVLMGAEDNNDVSEERREVHRVRHDEHGQEVQESFMAARRGQDSFMAARRVHNIKQEDGSVVVQSREVTAATIQSMGNQMQRMSLQSGGRMPINIQVSGAATVSVRVVSSRSYVNKASSSFQHMSLDKR